MPRSVDAARRFGSMRRPPLRREDAVWWFVWWQRRNGSAVRSRADRLPFVPNQDFVQNLSVYVYASNPQ